MSKRPKVNYIILRDTCGLQARLDAAKLKTGISKSRLIRDSVERSLKKIGV